MVGRCTYWRLGVVGYGIEQNFGVMTKAISLEFGVVGRAFVALFSLVLDAVALDIRVLHGATEREFRVFGKVA